jgi:hypothetical protein
MPAVLHIEQDSAFVQLADTTGTLLEEIAVDSSAVELPFEPEAPRSIPATGETAASRYATRAGSVEW